MTTKREEWTAGINEVWDANGERVADVYCTTEHGDVDLARRIAAVPDMEAALMRLVACERGIEASNWGGEDVVEFARRALRKAGRLP